MHEVVRKVGIWIKKSFLYVSLPFRKKKSTADAACVTYGKYFAVYCTRLEIVYNSMHKQKHISALTYIFREQKKTSGTFNVKYAPLANF